jgi:hypothetical protein
MGTRRDELSTCRESVVHAAGRLIGSRVAHERRLWAAGVSPPSVHAHPDNLRGP